jgi:hypothetical protein
MPANSFGERMKHWEGLVAGSKANSTDLEIVRGYTTRLDELIPLTKQANTRQLLAQAEFQQSTRDQEALVEEARELANRIRNGVRTLYGVRSEKLVEFGLKPQRKRGRLKRKKPLEPAAAAEKESGGDAAA